MSTHSTVAESVALSDLVIPPHPHSAVSDGSEQSVAESCSEEGEGEGEGGAVVRGVRWENSDDWRQAAPPMSPPRSGDKKQTYEGDDDDDTRPLLGKRFGKPVRLASCVDSPSRPRSRHRRSTFWAAISSLLPGATLGKDEDGNGMPWAESDDDESDAAPTKPRKRRGPLWDGALESRVAEELKHRMEVYNGLTLLSALMVQAALHIFTDARNTAADAQYWGVACATQLLASIVLALNIFGTSVILLQRHKAGVRISHKKYRDAIQGWRRLWPQRHRAVWAITYSLPGLLISSSLYMVAGEDVDLSNFISSGFLAVASIYILVSIGMMESEFNHAAQSDSDVVGMLAWTSGYDSRVPI
eukprot:m.373244 g.373244  ORF g.373244 m.373244 type:complete len:358 (-) comp28161_c0_seq19:236-1309(-)